MKKSLHILSFIGISTLSIYVTVIAWYQAMQIKDFLPQWRDGLASHCLPGDTGNLCTIYGDRFGAIAMGIALSIFLYPAALLYVITKPGGTNERSLLLTATLVPVILLLVHFSGLILYLTAD